MICMTCPRPAQEAGQPLTLGARAAGSIRTAWRAYWDWRARKATILILSSLDRRTLHDIGVNPSEIESLVNGCGAGDRAGATMQPGPGAGRRNVGRVSASARNPSMHPDKWRVTGFALTRPSLFARPPRRPPAAARRPTRRASSCAAAARRGASRAARP